MFKPSGSSPLRRLRRQRECIAWHWERPRDVEAADVAPCLRRFRTLAREQWWKPPAVDAAAVDEAEPVACGPVHTRFA
jgi:hypothetical protein